MAYDPNADDKVRDEDFLPFGAQPIRPAASPSRSGSVPRSVTAITPAPPDPELGARNRRVRENVSRFGGSLFAFVVAVLITASSVISVVVSDMSLDASTSQHFARFLEVVEYVFGIGIAFLTIVAIWMIVLSSRFSAAGGRGLGFRMMRTVAVLIAVRLVLTGIALIPVAFVSLFGSFFGAVFVLAVLTFVFWFAIRFMKALFAFLDKLIAITSDRGSGYHPDPGSLTTGLFVVGGLMLFVAVLLPLLGDFDGITSDFALRLKTSASTALIGMTWILGGALLKKYINAVSSAPVE
ncbi:MAG: hypothetical protein WC509_08720 [Candidatus Izemoplasmatales bacterium]